MVKKSLLKLNLGKKSKIISIVHNALRIRRISVSRVFLLCVINLTLNRVIIEEVDMTCLLVKDADVRNMLTGHNIKGV